MAPAVACVQPVEPASVSLVYGRPCFACATRKGPSENLACWNCVLLRLFAALSLTVPLVASMTEPTWISALPPRGWNCVPPFGLTHTSPLTGATSTVCP